eukprot:TRINITY_DN112003_c0_g1_i1.p1 TRINITY_DN112003_c0_g1~~TRINITY_DN112003_c0_g1_i1.p1  ORF type:complete len:287 (+),score=49.93 TRINITY_DN112003_c0_g1_i1:103-963(+)
MGESSSKSYYSSYDGQDLCTPRGDRTPRTPRDRTVGCSPWSDDSRWGDDSTPMWGPASDTDTVIIFDWDDTLLCSSAINAQQWSQSQLEQLEQMVETILHTAMQLGETMIVTNGNGSWVQDSTRRFFPNLEKTLNRVTVMSARACYETSFPGDPFSWKRQAFKEILARRRQEGYHPSGVNLVVLGDSPAEIEAARTATKVLCGKSRVKTVKFKEAPSVNELLGQLRRVLQELASIVQEERSLSRGLVQRTIPGSIDQLSSWASGWRLSDTEYWDYSRVAATLLVGA